jgi:hypothetical protein
MAAGYCFPTNTLGYDPQHGRDLTTLLTLLSIRAAPFTPESPMIAYTCSFITDAGFVLSYGLSTFKYRHEALAGLTIAVAARIFVYTLSYAHASVCVSTTCLTGIYMARPPSKISDLVV